MTEDLGEPIQEYLFEFYTRGRYTRVSVIDPQTNTELSFVADSRLTVPQLKRLAMIRLKRVQARQP